MTLRERIPKTTGRQAALLLGCLFTLSCISLLSEGFDHLRIFLPLAALNILVGAFTPERLARVFLVVEACAIFGLLGYQFIQLHERHVNQIAASNSRPTFRFGWGGLWLAFFSAPAQAPAVAELLC